MRILTKTRKFFNALRCLFSKWTAEDCRKAGVDTRYSAEIFPSIESKLEAAAYALRRIECLTNEKAVMFMPDIDKIHRIALDAMREAQK